MISLVRVGMCRLGSFCLGYMPKADNIVGVLVLVLSLVLTNIIGLSIIVMQCKQGFTCYVLESKDTLLSLNRPQMLVCLFF